jgi:hypothetical protein
MQGKMSVTTRCKSSFFIKKYHILYWFQEKRGKQDGTATFCEGSVKEMHVKEGITFLRQK